MSIEFCIRFKLNRLNLSLFITGHGGSDGLHGYVPSLDYVIEDMVSLCLSTYFYVLFKIFRYKAESYSVPDG